MLDDEAPTKVWQLYEDGQRNTRSHQRLMKWIRHVIEAQGKAENGGARNVLSVTCGGQPLTPRGGFFVVIMRAPEGWGKEDLPLAFSCKNLYLLGFMRRNRWHFFDDAEDLPEGVWERLPFSGGYRGDKFNSVDIGVFELWLSHDALVDYPWRSQAEVENGVFRLIVVICEAVRFPAWRRRVGHLLAGYGRAEAVNQTRLYSLLCESKHGGGRDDQQASVHLPGTPRRHLHHSY
ncbi:hypothetical protein ACP4OV_014418 [Aristida adscensionis]